MRVINQLETLIPNAKVQSWRDYNKSFFGALRVEKNMLLLLVALIFVVVAINIYNGMRRLVFERKSEIAIFSAIGASTKQIKAIFIMRGFTTGVLGSIVGVILGLLSHEDLTGYEIKKRMDTSLKYFWGASYGSIYPALSDLVERGLAIKRDGSENNRSKIIYSITDEGRSYLKEWLKLPVERDELRYETLVMKQNHCRRRFI